MATRPFHNFNNLVRYSVQTLNRLTWLQPLDTRHPRSYPQLPLPLDPRPSTLFGRPVRADSSAAKITSCERAASSRLVNGISSPASNASKNAENCFSYG